MLNTTLKVTERQKINLAPDGVLDAPAVFATSDPAVVQITIAANAHWIYPQAVGTAVVTINATSNGLSLSEQINVTVEPVPATTLGVTLDPPVAK